VQCQNPNFPLAPVNRLPHLAVPALEFHTEPLENSLMQIRGRVQNGVVIPEGDLALPEGAVVTVKYAPSPPPAHPGPRRRVRLPLVRSTAAGTRQLTGDAIAELLEYDDFRS